MLGKKKKCRINVQQIAMYASVKYVKSIMYKQAHGNDRLNFRTVVTFEVGGRRRIKAK